MTRKTKALVFVLRFLGITSLFALVAVFMPLSWMVSIHHWLGMGEMPSLPVVEYLARSVSAFYAFFGLVATGIDWAVQMPLWWTVSEGPPGIALGVLIFLLACSDNRNGRLPAEGTP